jgi:putative transposase
MSRNYYSEIHLHIVWHTKESGPLLVPQVEAETHHYLRGRLINTPGVFVHQVGGTETTSIWRSLFRLQFLSAT